MPQILTVDDDPMNIYVISEMLKTKSLKSDDAINGEAAIKKIKNRINMKAAGTGPLYKLILLDYSMPGMDGTEVAKEIHRIYRESDDVTAAEIPYICCCTAYTEKSSNKLR